MKVLELFRDTNRHLGSNIPHFSKSTDSCKNATIICEFVCKAKQGNYQFPSVKNYMNTMYEVSHTENFYKLLEKDLTIIQAVASVTDKYHYSRLHTSGDIESLDQYMMTMRLLNKFPLIKFLIYTKVPLTAPYYAMKPDNVIIRFSYDRSTPIEYVKLAKEQNVPLSFMDDRLEKVSHMTKHENGFVCNSICDKCKFCWNSTKDVVFPMTANNFRKKAVRNYTDILERQESMVKLL